VEAAPFQPQRIASAGEVRIYWYWPFARLEDFDLAESTALEGDELVLHALDRPGVPRESTSRVKVRAELPEVTPMASGSVVWAASRASTYMRRLRLRSDVLRSDNFDVAHVAFLNRFTDVVDLNRIRRSVCLVSTVHDVVPHEARLPPAAQDLLLGRLYSACGTIVVHHDVVREELLSRFSVDPARVHVVPHWVSSPRLPNDERSLSDPPSVLFFGTMRRNKGILLLLDAIEQLAPTKVRFHFAGRGDHDIERAVEAAAARHANVTAEMRWITPERKNELFSSADLVILPYTSFSSQSGVLHDAYGHHIPVVVTDVGALGESVRSSKAGWVVPATEASALAASIQVALSDTGTWVAASRAARDAAVRQSPTNVGRALHRVYESALKG